MPDDSSMAWLRMADSFLGAVCSVGLALRRVGTLYPRHCWCSETLDPPPRFCAHAVVQKYQR